MRVYIAGPYTNGNTTQNVHEAIRVGRILMTAGFDVFIPHLSHFQQKIYPRDYEDWMKHDLSWLKVCDIVFRIPGYSPGTDREVQEAKELGKTIWTDLNQLLQAAYKDNLLEREKNES